MLSLFAQQNGLMVFYLFYFCMMVKSIEIVKLTGKMSLDLKHI